MMIIISLFFSFFFIDHMLTIVILVESSVMSIFFGTNGIVEGRTF